MARCEDCIHEKVCLHRANVQTDTYAYMGVKYDTEKCEHFMPADAAPKSDVHEAVEKLMSATDKVICEAKSEVAREIFAEFELHIRKAVEGWLKQLKFEIEKYKMDMIMARLDAFGYCIYVLNNLREKYTEGETNGNKAGTEI